MSTVKRTSYCAEDIGLVSVGDVLGYSSLNSYRFLVVAIFSASEYHQLPRLWRKVNPLLDSHPYVLLTRTEDHQGSFEDRALARHLGVDANWTIVGGHLRPPVWTILNGLGDNVPVGV